MVFWASVLVFIASIMTYMFYPRNDQYDQELRKAEYAINAFVNQHQAARDYMYQMIEWHPSEQMKQDSPFFNVLPFRGLQSMMPWAMRFSTKDGQFMHEIYAVCPDNNAGNCQTRLTPNPTLQDSIGHYTSVLVCMDDTLAAIKDCPSNKQYLLTYGYPPNMFEESDWWQSRTTRLETWRKAILRRTRGSASCGVLYAVGEYGADDHYYAIDTTQRLTGVVRRPDSGDNEVQYIVPPAVTENMAHSGETGNVGLDTCRSEAGCTERLDGILFCLSPFNNPYYTGGLAFMVDKINNLGYGTSSSGPTVPLEGKVLGTDLTPSSGSFYETNYTIAGVIQNVDGAKDILWRRDPDSISRRGLVSINCTQSNDDKICSLTVNGLTASGISAKSAISFAYVGTPGGQVLYVNDDMDDDVNDNKPVSSSTGAPVLSHLELADPSLIQNDNQVLRHLRIYKQALGETQIQNNYQADKKRFGI